ncbi:tyrosine-type recombinase/integrase [Rothia sp. ZJ932]|uniref:tyrosine-type recombinase/integrase n=1 Tax=Rothia sp. ZJ932 TaxID=2810516 RepID=UPI0019687399|nr:tyrosine-type recombinase/integrase [Rothia sp. ZJ932]QRZ61717.1 tyrosine-type recombinase/integrase [Rothia sp. ZJ932]
MPRNKTRGTSRDTYSLANIEPYRLISEAARAFYRRNNRYPSPNNLRNVESIAKNLYQHLTVRCSDKPWYEHDVWNMHLDNRIPRRENEPHAERVISLEHITQPWLKEATRFWFSQALTYEYYTWTSIASRVTHLNYFSRFLTTYQHSPVTLGESLGVIRKLTTAFTDYLKTPVEGCHAKALSETTIGSVTSTLQRFYEFAYENKDLVAENTDDKAWLGITADHTRLFPAYKRKKKGKAHPVTFFTPDELAVMLSHLEVLKTPMNQRITLEIPGREPATYGGVGDEQAARVWMIQALTGRRASEILMMDFQPLTMLDVDPEKIQEDSFIARMNYQQTKVDGVEPTILVDVAVVNIIQEQQAWVEEKYPGLEHPYLFPNPRANFTGARPRSYRSYADTLKRLDQTVKLTNKAGEPLRFSQTHRLRHTRATELLNNGVPVHVVQRYLGHRSPEMTMRYAETLAATAEAEFLRYKKVGSDDRDLGLSAKDLLEISQLDHRADRILPNGYCMLPPTQSCDKGNACLPCGAFATDASYIQEHREQLTRLEALIDERKNQYKARRGEDMPETNVWLTGRLREKTSLEAIITKLEDEAAQNKAVSGAGTSGRVALTLITNPAKDGTSPIIQPNLRTHR